MSFPYQDQVPRLKAFREAHPDIRVDDPVSTRAARWTAHRDGEILAAEYELARLLDRLDWLLGGA